MQPGALTVRAFAKINLCLEVLNRRPDGFHNLRTIFQTISLHDVISIEAEPAGKSEITLESDVAIPGENLIVRAARAVLEETGITARVRFGLQKRIPMGGGLGGGSTDAAAVLLALPGLLGAPIPLARLIETGSALGSDVPFFLIGGAAVGLARGTELYPLAAAEMDRAFGLLALAPVHVSTPDAYRSLGRTDETPSGVAVSPTERVALALAAGDPSWTTECVNDFEPAVFHQHEIIGRVRDQMEMAGAAPARMTGSGAAVFGLFGSQAERDQAMARVTAAPTVAFELLSRDQYRRQFVVQTGLRSHT